MKQRIFLHHAFIGIRLRGNKGLIFWFHKPKAFTYGKLRKYWIPRCYIDDISILTMNEEEGLKYLSNGLDKIINKIKDVASPEQVDLLSKYRLIMNKMVNYYNSEWKI